MKRCRACNRPLSASVNERDMLCGESRGRTSCTMKAFLFGESKQLCVRPVDREFWSSDAWQVVVDQWLESGAA